VAAPQRPLVSRFRPSRPWFNPRAGCVIDRLALEVSFLIARGRSPVSYSICSTFSSISRGRYSSPVTGRSINGLTSDCIQVLKLVTCFQRLPGWIPDRVTDYPGLNFLWFLFSSSRQILRCDFKLGHGRFLSRLFSVYYSLPTNQSPLYRFNYFYFQCH
jgi:hypothetical protein